MIDALARLAPLAIELMHHQAYANGGYAHPNHYAYGGYTHGGAINHAAHAIQSGYAHGGMPHYADGGDMDGQQIQQGQPQQAHPMDYAPNNGMNNGVTQYVQPEPNMNAPMAPYAHGGYAHPQHYAYGGYAHGGHMPHYGFGGALKGAFSSAKTAAAPHLSQLAQKGANYAGKQAGQAAQGYATKHFGAEAGQQVGQAARSGVAAAGHDARARMGLGGNHPQQMPQRAPQPPAAPAAIQTAPQQESNAMDELPFAGGEYRRGGHMMRKNVGGPLYPYHR